MRIPALIVQALAPMVAPMPEVPRLKPRTLHPGAASTYTARNEWDSRHVKHAANLFTNFSLCSPLLVPQMVGVTQPPGFVTVNESVRQRDARDTDYANKIL